VLLLLLLAGAKRIAMRNSPSNSEERDKDIRNNNDNDKQAPHILFGQETMDFPPPSFANNATKPRETSSKSWRGWRDVDDRARLKRVHWRAKQW
jgi:hypothetical protein